MSINNKILSGLALILILSCNKADTPVVDCTGTTPTYTKDIAPIFNSSCASAGCHSSVNPERGIDLSNYSMSKSASLNTRVLASIKHESGVSSMPQGAPKLSDAKIKLVECWIKNGAPQ